jgi:predicted PurR-regulated permease PerM
MMGKSLLNFLPIYILIALTIFLFVFKDFIIQVLLALIFAIVLSPPVDLLEKKRIPRFFGSVMVFSLVILSIVIIYLLIAPILNFEVQKLMISFPEYLKNFDEFFQNFLNNLQINPGHYIWLNLITQKLHEHLQEWLGNFLNLLGTSTFDLINKALSWLIFPILTLFFMKDLSVLTNGILKMCPKNKKVLIMEVGSCLTHGIRAYVKGQLILSITIGILTGLGLFFLGIEYFFLLGVLAAILEFIPYLGPIIAAIPALIISIAISPIKAFAVLIFYIILHQLEGVIIAPNIMSKSIDVPPSLVIIVLTIAAALGSIPGMLLSIPLTAISKSLYEYWQKNHSEP